MKSKLLALLKTVFKDMGFSDKAFTGVADYLAATVKEEATDDEIKTIIDGVKPLLKSFQGDIDNRVNTAVEKAKKEAAKKVTGEDPDPEEDNDDDKEMPVWAKKLLGQNKKLSEELTSFKAGQTKQTLTEKLNAQLTEKKIPVAFAKGRVIDKEEDLETAVADIEKDFQEVKQGFINEGLSSGTPPLGSQASPDKTKIAADIDAWGAKYAPKTAVAAK